MLSEHVDALTFAGRTSMIMIDSSGITEEVFLVYRRCHPISRELDMLRVMFEATDPEAVGWYIKASRADVALFVHHSQIVQLEYPRAGICAPRSSGPPRHVPRPVSGDGARGARQTPLRRSRGGRRLRRPSGRRVRARAVSRERAPSTTGRGSWAPATRSARRSTKIPPAPPSFARATATRSPISPGRFEELRRAPHGAR